MAVTGPSLDESLIARRRALLAALGDPHLRFPIVHVGGTNGKGSTVALIAAVLQAGGYRVGRYTSPDLHGPHERIALDGRPIDRDRFAQSAAEVGAVAERVAEDFPALPPWRPFDLLCAQAWRYYADTAEIVVVEVGLGGRRDATNVFARPEMTAITAIDRDHTLCLGHDLAAIALEKAGIFRPGVPAATTAQGEALAVLRDEARRLGTPLRAVEPLDGVSTAGGWRVSTAFGIVDLPLAGRFQLENAGLAIAALETLRAAGWRITESTVREGFASVQWPARMERLPDATGGAWLLDGAHNPAAIEALTSAWGAPDVVVAGIQATKDGAAMIRALTAPQRPVILTEVPDAASWTPEMLALNAIGTLEFIPAVRQALDRARAIAPNGTRCVTGSLHLVAAARALILQGAI
ncbi:MAG TPA: bifunctional folylpolyglutamate synthase/dihydrofolate synthase [Oscillatoriaceae cyanobacterium]